MSSKFTKGSGVYTCRICKHRTRDTGSDGAFNGACDLCYELAGEENHVVDNDGKLYGDPANIRAMLKALDDRNGNGTARRLFEDVCNAALYRVIAAKVGPA